MPRLFDAYRAVHEQGFIPIFVDDDLDTMMLVDGCLEAGMKVIEYTLRRKDVGRMVPEIRKRYPDLFVLAGSTLDDVRVVAQRRRQFPWLLTVDELDAMDVDGFVSMLGWREENIRRFSGRRLVIPCAMTNTEAFQQMGAGAQFIKMNGPGTELVKKCRAAAVFQFGPIMLSGGVPIEKIPEAYEAGAVTVAAGFDLTLKDRPRPVRKADVVAAMKAYLAAAHGARVKAFPDLARAVGGPRQAWLDALPHFHPF